MHDFLYFLGRFHVLALHLPIGIILVAVVLDWVARRERYRALAAVAPFLWGAAALSAVVTVVLGYLHFAEGAFTGPAANAHRFWHDGRRRERADLLVVAPPALIAGERRDGRRGRRARRDHGPLRRRPHARLDVPWEYAPGPLRALLGVEQRRPLP